MSAPTLPAPALPFPDLCIRPYQADDAEAFAQAVRESVASVGPWMPWCHAAYTVDEAHAWFALCERERAAGSAFEFGLFDAGGALLGGAGLNQINRQHNFCNLGYWVRASRQRRGVARGAVRLLAGYGFEELGLTRIEIVIALGNTASEAVALGAGAVREGVARNRLCINGQAQDATMFGLLP